MTQTETPPVPDSQSVRQTESVRCVDCGSDSVINRGPCKLTSAIDGLPEYEKQLISDRGAGQLYQCKSCGLGFRFPQVGEAELQALYANMPTRRWKYEQQVNTAWQLASKWLSNLNRTDSAKPRLLDVGAFDGIFLKSLGDSWDRFAVEPSESACESLEAMGVTVIDRFLNPPAVEHAEQFDVVTLFDVFEHLRQPGHSLSDAVQFLKPGGHLILSTGNCAHWTWKWLEGDHWYCHPLQHLTFATPQFFTNWAEQSNCQVRQMTPHPHHPGTFRKQFQRVLETTVWGGLKSNWLRPVSSLCMRIPGLSYLRHRATGPYAPELADHLFVVLEKGKTPVA
ncbi:MAG: class I SAM-dependent methyltransferase [Planctomycetaceae bacterium]